MTLSHRDQGRAAAVIAVLRAAETQKQADGGEGGIHGGLLEVVI